MGSWNVLVHWINSLPPESCLLVNSLEDLTDGEVICDIVTAIHGKPIPYLSATKGLSPLSKVRAALCFLVGSISQSPTTFMHPALGMM